MMILGDETASQTNTLLLVGGIFGGIGTLVGLLTKFILDMVREKNTQTNGEEEKANVILRQQVNILETKCGNNESKIDKLIQQQIECEKHNAEMKVEIKYLTAKVDKLEKENLHLSSPEIILPPPIEVKNS